MPPDAEVRSGNRLRMYSSADHSWAKDDGVTSCQRPEFASIALRPPGP